VVTFPFPSAYDQVITVLEVIGKVVVVVPLTKPSQLSVAKGVAGVTEQIAVIGARAATLATGPVTSTMITF
jgi:hypothetical protein